MANSYEVLPLPSFSPEYGQYESQELLFSYEGGFTQFDATLKGGQGVLLLGTALGQDVTGKYGKANTAPFGPAEGFLRRSADTGAVASPAGDQLCNLVTAGFVKLELVDKAYGGTGDGAAVPAAVVTDLKGRLNTKRSFIRF